MFSHMDPPNNMDIFKTFSSNISISGPQYEVYSVCGTWPLYDLP